MWHFLCIQIFCDISCEGGEMVLLFAIPSLLFLGGLGVMMWAEARNIRRDENERDPMFVRKSR